MAWQLLESETGKNQVKLKCANANRREPTTNPALVLKFRIG
jgi:hypothetical protein